MIHLVCGGASSGKSEYAENLAMELCCENGEKIYVATMLAYDEESKKRIAIHQYNRKNKGFKTFETPFDIKNIQKKITKNYVIREESLSNLVANEMDEKVVNPH
ncbi:MAG: bifunctional adenosylcobinamide kinase/adenosylcobinamide-phosphate guanylyltransferase, partial [Oscillospiraceae bacterium]